MAYNSFRQAAERRPRINGRVRSITEMAGHRSILGDRDTADRMQRAGIAPYAGMHGAASRTRADNIAAARADGTFDAKRNAFNAANKGSYMDEAGRIGPRAPGTGGGAASSPPATSFVSAPDGQGGSKQVKIQTPSGGMVAAASSPKPAAQPAQNMLGTAMAGVKQAMGFKRSASPAASQGGGFTSMPPGSRDLYAEEKAREEKAREAQAKPASMVAAASAPDPLMKQATALGNAAKIANSSETAATMAKAKASLPAKPTSMVAAAAPPKPMTPPAPSGAAFGAARSKPLVAAASQPKAPAVAAQTQATMPKSTAPTTAPETPKPSWLDKKIAANPDGIFGKVADVAGKAKRGFVSAANAVAPVAANALASSYNAIVANPANAIRGAIKERAKDAPTGAAAKLAKKLPGMSDEASKTAKKKAKPIVTASN